MSDARRWCLPDGLPRPVPEPLTAPYWQGLREERLFVQRCDACHSWQWGPEWICHKCHGFDLSWVEIEPEGCIHSWIRVWHPTHSALQGAVPYVVVLVELPHAGGIRMVGNLASSEKGGIPIGAEVEGVFEHHAGAGSEFTLLQWRLKNRDRG